ncbi:uncharacterized protein LOC102804968 [Saccoglossus kowalevskii]|uniref:Uncharacterized protein LOC102804968 n=1 Tax=Saccoglossus kowalevskii TaxID=10224 RepID=A0ABM0MBC4_SACKO|nr:PREDICTED: uncharacterized protein LOC102804968 [Saccoglossus kowalevskii]
MRRFTVRRSTPRFMVSDNGSTFIAAANELTKLMNDRTVQQHLSINKITWRFNPKRMPWAGGLFERMISITKKCIRKVLGKANASFIELSTLLSEVESAVNDRPLTYLSPSVDDLSPLTPSHLLNGRPLRSLLQINASDPNPNFELNNITANNRVQYLSTLQNGFRKRWVNEYLTSLTERHLYEIKGTTSNRICVGEIILIHEDVTKRVTWQLARVTQLLPGADGIVRVVELKTKHGKTNRPVPRLYPLELNAETPENLPVLITKETDNYLPVATDNEIYSLNTVRPLKSKRAAAIQAAERIHLLQDENLV